MPGGCCCVSTGWFDWYGPKNTQNTVGYGMDAFPSAYPTPRHYRVNSMLWREPSMRPEGEPYGMWSFPDYWHVRMYPSEPAIYHEAAIIQALHLPVPASEGKVWVIRQGDIDNEKWNGGWYVNMVEDPFLALSQPSWTKGTGCIIEDETKITVSGSNPTTGCYVTQTVSPFLLTAGPPDYQIMRGHSRVRVNAATGELSDIYIKIKGTGTGSGNLDSLVVVDLSDGSVVSDYGLPNMPVNEDGEDDSPYGNENFPADEVIVTETYDNTWDISFWLGNHNDSYGNITIGPYSGGFVIDANSGDGIYVYDVSVREFTGNAPSSFDLALFNATHKTIDLHYFLDLDDADNNKRETSVFNYGHWFPHYNRVGQWNNENFGYYQGAGLYNWFDDIDKGSMMLRNRNVENIGRGLQVSNDAIHILNPVLYDGFPAASSAWMYFKLPNTGGGPEIQFGGNGSTLYWVEHPTTC